MAAHVSDVLTIIMGLKLEVVGKAERPFCKFALARDLYSRSYYGRPPKADAAHALVSILSTKHSRREA